MIFGVVFHVPGNGFRTSCSIAFAGIEVRLNSLDFPRSSLLPNLILFEILPYLKLLSVILHISLIAR